MRFNLEMNSLPVVDQGRVGFKGRPTVGTQVGLDVGVDRDLMDSKRSIPCEIFMAKLACERFIS